MRVVQVIVLFLSILLYSGCLTGDKDKNNSNKNVETYKVDLDGDFLPETIEIENRFETDKNSVIKITKGQKDKKKKAIECTFTIPGYYKKVEFTDLNDDGIKQMAVYYDTEGDYLNLAIYKLKNNKIIKMFSVSSNCDIEADFTSLLARVKVGKSKDGSNDCAGAVTAYWEVWVYTGEHFIKEK
ncbi:MAG: hypothetical protein WC412_06805 [Candidatus Omnitrophota bacterium]|jgi:hypothetical protein